MQRAVALKRFHRPSLYHNHLKPLTSTTTIIPKPPLNPTTTSTQHPFSTTTTSSSQLPKIKYLACTAGLLFGGAIIYNSFSFPKHKKPQQQPSCYDYNLKLNFEVFSHLIELKRERDEQAWNFLKTQIRIYSLELYFAKFGLMEILYRDSLHHIPPCGDAIRQCLEAIDNTQHALLQLDTAMDICMRNSIIKFLYLRKIKYWVARIGKFKTTVFDLLEYFQKLEQQETRRSRENYVTQRYKLE